MTHELSARNGAARTGELFAAGIGRRQLQAAIAKGTIERPARGVVVLPGADPLLVRCLTTNSLLTCVSAAEGHGLWVLQRPERVHLLRTDGRLMSERAVVHRQSWVTADPGSRFASLADVVLHALSCLPELEALVIAESAVQKVEGLPPGPPPGASQRAGPRRSGSHRHGSRFPCRDTGPNPPAKGRAAGAAAGPGEGGGVGGPPRRGFRRCRDRRERAPEARQTVRGLRAGCPRPGSRSARRAFRLRRCRPPSGRDGRARKGCRSRSAFSGRTAGPLRRAFL